MDKNTVYATDSDEYFVIRLNTNGQYLKEGSALGNIIHGQDTAYTPIVYHAHSFNKKYHAEFVADKINEYYTSNGIMDVYGQPKHVDVCKVTTTLVVESAE